MAESGKLLSDEHMLIYYGDPREHKHGVAMLLNIRILLVILHDKPFNIMLNQVEAPTNIRTGMIYMNYIIGSGCII